MTNLLYFLELTVVGLPEADWQRLIRYSIVAANRPASDGSTGLSGQPGRIGACASH